MPHVLSKSTPPPDETLQAGRPVTLCAGRWPGVEFFVKTQDISRLTTWTITDSRHTAIVHLDGPIHRLETELLGAGRAWEPPMPGEVWVVPGRARYASLAHGRTVRYAELFFDREHLARMTGASEALRPVRPLAGHYDRFLHSAVERLRQLTDRREDMARLAAECLSQTLYTHFFLQFAGDAAPARRRRPAPQLPEETMRRLSDYVEANLGQPMTLADLAFAAGMRPQPFLPAFRTSFGTTPAQFIIERRLRRARWLLRNTTLDITRIALDTGFSSHAHLTTAFRTRLGVPPKEFRAGLTLPE
ncbi:AraC family transcriptional regulator [uncultured Paludibaculum sp.]|uniref:AraC family transcriptional regulator n=1 Tax=uncultured Paludibaculum sp. TaxID=1765020 RepID=UPI002AAAE706|nr:AraC family transcriptional regulator [uncultured Paludibaculum sp.]